MAFRLLGLLPGAVALRGKVVPVQAGQPHGQGVAGEADTVKVLFEPPVLFLGSSLHIRIGARRLAGCACWGACVVWRLQLQRR